MSSGSVKVVTLQGGKPVTPSDKKPVTPSEKKEKRLKKTIRKKEQRFQETNDKNYLLERDQAQDELNELLLSREIAKKNKKIPLLCHSLSNLHLVGMNTMLAKALREQVSMQTL